MRKILSLVLILAIMSMATTAYAQSGGRKLFRGIVNSLTGFLELPITIFKVSKNEGYPKGLTYGTAMGITLAVQRTLIGLYDLLTFPIPNPEGFAPLIQPETIFSGETLEADNPSMAIDFSPLGGELRGREEAVK